MGCVTHHTRHVVADDDNNDNNKIYGDNYDADADSTTNKYMLFVVIDWENNRISRCHMIISLFLSFSVEILTQLCLLKMIRHVWLFCCLVTSILFLLMRMCACNELLTISACLTFFLSLYFDAPPNLMFLLQ